MLAMMNREMTRKEFIGAIAAFLGVALLSRIPFQDAAKHLGGASGAGSYGNATYGGINKK